MKKRLVPAGKGQDGRLAQWHGAGGNRWPRQATPRRAPRRGANGTFRLSAREAADTAEVPAAARFAHGGESSGGVSAVK
jgi:hypothetical protein